MGMSVSCINVERIQCEGLWWWWRYRHNNLIVGPSDGWSQIHMCMRSSYSALLAKPPTVIRESKTPGDDDLSGICCVQDSVGLGSPMAEESDEGCVYKCVCVCV